MHSGGIKVSYPRLRSWFHLLLAESSRISHITSLNPTFLVCEMSLRFMGSGYGICTNYPLSVLGMAHLLPHQHSPASSNHLYVLFLALRLCLFCLHVSFLLVCSAPISKLSSLFEDASSWKEIESREETVMTSPLLKGEISLCHFPGTPPGSISTVGRFKVHGEITSNTFNSSFLTFSIPMTIVHTYSECGPTGDFKAC